MSITNASSFHRRKYENILSSFRTPTSTSTLLTTSGWQKTIQPTLCHNTKMDVVNVKNSEHVVQITRFAVPRKRQLFCCLCLNIDHPWVYRGYLLDLLWTTMLRSFVYQFFAVINDICSCSFCIIIYFMKQKRIFYSFMYICYVYKTPKSFIVEI